jgi:hypothetical protein
LALLISSIGATATTAQSVTPVGVEFQINQYTAASQLNPAVSMDSAGRFVVAWRTARDGAGFGIFARRFDSNGAAIGAEFQVNVSTLGDQEEPDIDLSSDGAFVVTWQSDNGVPAWVFARRYSSSGVAQGVEIQLSAHTSPDDQEAPEVGLDAQGDFVVTWQSDRSGTGFDVVARRFSSAGAPQGLEFVVNLFTSGYQGGSDVGVESNGDFVIVWESTTPETHIFVRRFSSAGAPLDDASIVDMRASAQSEASVGVDADGDFVVTWERDDGDGDQDAVLARRFSSNGIEIGDEFQVNVWRTGEQADAAISMDASGDFVIAFNSEQDPALDVFMRLFRADGSAQPFDVLVNTTTTSSQLGPDVAADTDGDFVIVWASSHTPEPFDIFAQRFNVSPLLDVDGNGVIDPLTDALLVLRFTFGFSGATLTTGAVGAGCTRCDAPSITAYLQGFV